VDAVSSAEWPGFRGPHRNSSIPGLRIVTDWSQSPPVELWRRPVGPGVSSLAVHGDYLYTQEQRGDDEVVASYRVSTGEPVWRHHDPDRFWDSHAGAGPRSTPTLRDGRVYTFGATGILNALDAATGAIVWSRNAAVDTEATVPGWGFASSPLVVDDVVMVAVGGIVAAYDSATGNPRWSGAGRAGGENYSSPHLLSIDGVEQVLLMSATGATSVEPASGKVLWEHGWPGAPIVQPAQTEDGDVLISTAGGSGALGLRRLAVAKGPGGWSLEERWTSSALKPYFNDFVVQRGHAFGFDGSILASVDLVDGARARLFFHCSSPLPKPLLALAPAPKPLPGFGRTSIDFAAAHVHCLNNITFMHRTSMRPPLGSGAALPAFRVFNVRSRTLPSVPCHRPAA